MSHSSTQTGATLRVLSPRLPTAEKLRPYIERIDAARIYSNYGPLSREFAVRLGELTGASGVTLTSNGTTAIDLALRVRAMPGRRYCLMPAYTFIASAHAVCNAGLTPYLVDTDPLTLTLTPELAEATLTHLAEKPAAVLVISAFGAPPDIEGWAAFEDRHGIPVVFDAAAAVTALAGVRTQPVCVSLHATKVLGIGEGGAILCADTDLTSRATAMTGFGFAGPDRTSAYRGGNFRISEYAAAIGLAVLDELPARLEALRSLTRYYEQKLSHKATTLQDGVGSNWVAMTLNAIVPANSVNDTTRRLDEDQIEWRRWWGLGCHRHPAFADVPRGNLDATDEIAPRVIGVPFRDDLQHQEIDRVVACLP